MYLATILAAQTDFGEYPRRVWFDQRIQKAGLRFAEGLCSKLDSRMINWANLQAPINKSYLYNQTMEVRSFKQSRIWQQI